MTGVRVYWIIVVATILLGLIMPQQGYGKKYYIWVMAIIHTFVCGFRYMYLTGDLRNYAADYYNYRSLGWFNSEVFQEGRNTGFAWLMKFISGMTNGNFQILLLVIAIIIEVALAILIYRYSPKPWMSYLVWNCMGFYIFGFSAIKQALAMAFLMIAMVYIFEERPKAFVITVLIAGTIHTPALIFLPAYWICKFRLNTKVILSYLVFAGIVFSFRTSIVEIMTDLYYDETSFVMNTDVLGGGFFVIVLILICGVMLKGLTNSNFRRVYNLIIVAAIFQMFAGFDNVFTRLANYYLQFAVLLIPMIFSSSEDFEERDEGSIEAIVQFDPKSIALIILVLMIILIWWYQRTTLGVDISSEVDNYLNFRFMWDV